MSAAGVALGAKIVGLLTKATDEDREVAMAVVRKAFRKRELSEKRSEAGKRGAAKRWQSDDTPDGTPDGKAMASAMANEMANTSPFATALPSPPGSPLSDPDLCVSFSDSQPDPDPETSTRSDARARGPVRAVPSPPPWVGRLAYQRAVREASGQRWAFPPGRDQVEAFEQAIRVHAIGEDDKPYAGEDLVGWVEHQARELVAFVARQDAASKPYWNVNPKCLLRFLNECPEKRPSGVHNASGVAAVREIVAGVGRRA